MGPDGVSWWWYAAGLVAVATLWGVVPPGYPVRRIVTVAVATLLGGAAGLLFGNLGAVLVIGALTATAGVALAEGSDRGRPGTGGTG